MYYMKINKNALHGSSLLLLEGGKGDFHGNRIHHCLGPQPGIAVVPYKIVDVGFRDNEAALDLDIRREVFLLQQVVF